MKDHRRYTQFKAVNNKPQKKISLEEGFKLYRGMTSFRMGSNPAPAEIFSRVLFSQNHEDLSPIK